MKIEFNISKTPGEPLCIPWNNIKFVGMSSLELIALCNSVSWLFTIISPSSDFSIIIFNNKSSTFVDFEITLPIIFNPNLFPI